MTVRYKRKILAAAALAAAAVPSPALASFYSEGEAGKVIFAVIIAIVVVLAARRYRIPDILRTAGAWFLAFAILIALYSYREPLEDVGREMIAALVPGMAVGNSAGEVVVRRSVGGQFMLNGAVDGEEIRFMFDTGASAVVLAATDAARAGIDPASLDYRLPVMTAAGVTEVAPVRLNNVSIGDINLTGVRAAVAKPGELDVSLLGMTFLNRITGFEVRRDRLVLIP